MARRVSVAEVKRGCGSETPDRALIRQGSDGSELARRLKASAYMFNLLQVGDLPLRRLVEVSHTLPVAEVSALVAANPVHELVVRRPDGRCALLSLERVERLAAENCAATVGELDGAEVVEVQPTMRLLDAVHTVAGANVGALMAQGRLITREALLSFNAWDEVFRARAARMRLC